MVGTCCKSTPCGTYGNMLGGDVPYCAVLHYSVALQSGSGVPKGETLRILACICACSFKEDEVMVMHACILISILLLFT